MLLTGPRDPDVGGFALESPFDDVSEAVGGAAVRLLTKAEVNEVALLEFAIQRIELESCCREQARRCLSDARIHHRRNWGGDEPGRVPRTARGQVVSIKQAPGTSGMPCCVARPKSRPAWP